jgi:hypothetical protein
MEISVGSFKIERVDNIMVNGGLGAATFFSHKSLTQK